MIMHHGRRNCPAVLSPAVILPIQCSFHKGAIEFSDVIARRLTRYAYRIARPTLEGVSTENGPHSAGDIHAGRDARRVIRLTRLFSHTLIENCHSYVRQVVRSPHSLPQKEEASHLASRSGERSGSTSEMSKVGPEKRRARKMKREIAGGAEGGTSETRCLRDVKIGTYHGIARCSRDTRWCSRGRGG